MSLNVNGAERTTTTGFMDTFELFGPKSVSEVSDVVQVDDQPIIVRAHALGFGEKVLVEIVDGKNDGEYFSPFNKQGRQVRLTRNCNVIAIATPGRYRFILCGTLGIVNVLYFRASMTHEFLLELTNMSGTCDDCPPIPDCLPPCGPASGVLSGEYPAPGLNAVQAADALAGSNNALVILANALCAPMKDCIDSEEGGQIPKCLPPCGPATGDLTGDYPNPTVKPSAIVNAVYMYAPDIMSTTELRIPVTMQGVRDSLMGTPMRYIFLLDDQGNKIGRIPIYPVS